MWMMVQVSDAEIEDAAPGMGVVVLQVHSLKWCVSSSPVWPLHTHHVASCQHLLGSYTCC